MPEPGWVRDPSGRYHQRFFDGTKWTDHVADEYGRRGVDPVEAIARAGGAVGGGTPGTGLLPATVSTAPAPRPAAATPLSRGTSATGLQLGTLVALVGLVLALVSFVFLPWFDGFRAVGEINSLRSALGSGATDVPRFGVWESSFFDAGWLVAVLAGVTTTHALATSSATPPVRPWLSLAPAVCLVWAVVGTMMLRGWLEDVARPIGGGAPSFGYGLLVGLAGMIAIAVAPLLPERRLGGR